jgi:hypothetical protein
MKKIFPYLAYAGAIPFAFCALCLVLGIQQLPLIGSVEKALTVYGLVISTFLCGAHWGQHLYINEGPWARALPILSNIITVLLWIGFLTLSFKLIIAMLVAAFVILLIVDHRLFLVDLINHHYFQTRLFVSSIVIVSLIISGIFS